MKEVESRHHVQGEVSCSTLLKYSGSRYGPSQGHSGGPQDAYDNGYFVEEHEQELNTRAVSKRHRANNPTSDEDFLEHLRKEDEKCSWVLFHKIVRKNTAPQLIGRKDVENAVQLQKEELAC